jgi:hypothetical protein
VNKILHRKFLGVLIAVIALFSSSLTLAVGTRENPVPIGTTADLEDGWKVTVMNVIPDATNAVLRENQFNDPPKAGNQFFLARIQAKYTGSGSDTFGGSYRLRAVGPSSVGYTTFTNHAGVIPDPLPDSEVFSGGVIEGNIGWEIRSSDASTLVMYDNPISLGDSKDRVYMALYGPGYSTSAIANATTDSSESHMRYIIENTFETNIAKLLFVTDVNCSLLENNSILVKIYIPNVSGFTFSSIEVSSENILSESIKCHVLAMNAYPIVENMVVQLFDSKSLYYSMQESRSTINGILASDLEHQPNILAKLVYKMLSTRQRTNSQ